MRPPVIRLIPREPRRGFRSPFITANNERNVRRIPSRDFPRSGAHNLPAAQEEGSAISHTGRLRGFATIILLAFAAGFLWANSAQAITCGAWSWPGTFTVVTAPAANSTQQVIGFNPSSQAYDLYISLTVSDTVAVGKYMVLERYSGGSTPAEAYLVASPNENGGTVEIDGASFISGDSVKMRMGAVAGASSSTYVLAFGYRPSCDDGVAVIGGTVTANAGTGTFATHDSSPSSTPVTGTVTANAGTGTFATHDSSPSSTPVTGTFWQATQPVSGTVTANAGSGTLNVNCTTGCSGGGGGGGGTVSLSDTDRKFAGWGIGLLVFLGCAPVFYKWTSRN